MAEIKRQPAVIYLDRNRMWYYTVGVPNILQLDFPVEIVSDLEILSKDKISELIKSFIETYKLEPTNITALLSPSITFEKDLPEGLPVEIEGETKSFLNFVPFEETYNKAFKLGKIVRVVAVNQELCNDIRSAFQERQFLVSAIVPFSILQQTMPELSNNLDLVYILAHVDGIRQHSLTGQEIVISNPGNSAATKSPEQQDNKRVFLLVGVFSVLLIVLGFVVYTQVIAPAPQIKSTSVVPTIVPARTSTSSTPAAITPTAVANPTLQTKPAETNVPATP